MDSRFLIGVRDKLRGYDRVSPPYRHSRGAAPTISILPDLIMIGFFRFITKSYK